MEKQPHPSQQQLIKVKLRDSGLALEYMLDMPGKEIVRSLTDFRDGKSLYIFAQGNRTICFNNDAVEFLEFHGPQYPGLKETIKDGTNTSDK